MENVNTPTLEEIGQTLASYVDDTLEPGEQITGIEQNAGGLWLTTSAGRTLTVIVTEAEGGEDQ